MYKLIIKRSIDIIASLFIILIFSPLYLIVGLVIYLQDFGNPIFKQERVGFNEKPFTLMKFRSMPINTKNVPSSQTKELKVTPFGKFIRRSNLDELPQLINIFKGDMSLIGPRPSLPAQTDLVALRRAKNVYSTKPGLTGLAQVNAFDNMPNEKKADWDGIYVKNITFIKDVKIVLRTIIYLTKKPPTY